MRKFKIIRDLPDVNKGTIFTWEESLNCYRGEKSIWVSPDRYLTYSKGTVEESPEWFEEVKEVKLDVPIGTKFKTSVGIHIYTITSINENTDVIIESPYNKYIYFIEVVNQLFKDGSWTIYKEPLFLDELGNEVFEGDKVFSVCHKYNWEIEDNRSVNKASKFVQDNYKEQAAWKFFKYKEDRDNYVLENKSRFSKKQVLDAIAYTKQIYSKCGIIPEERFIEKLRYE